MSDKSAPLPLSTNPWMHPFEDLFKEQMAKAKTATEKNIMEAMERTERRINQMAFPNHSHTLSDPTGAGMAMAMAGASVPEVTNKQHRKNMVAMRLRCPVDPFPLVNFETFLQGDTVYIAVVTEAGAVFLEDDRGLFPSDTVIGQLRLLLP